MRGWGQRAPARATHCPAELGSGRKTPFLWGRELRPQWGPLCWTFSGKERGQGGGYFTEKGTARRAMVQPRGSVGTQR